MDFRTHGLSPDPERLRQRCSASLMGKYSGALDFNFLHRVFLRLKVEGKGKQEIATKYDRQSSYDGKGGAQG